MHEVAARSAVPALLSLLLVVLPGCDPEASNRETGPTPIQVDAPVQVVQDEDLSQIMDVRPDPAGRTWVLSAHPPFVRVYDEDGSRLAAFGQPGGGPDEFGLARALVPPGNEGAGMGVLDTRRARILVFSPQGDVLDETGVQAQMAFPYEMQSAFFGEPFTAWRTGAGILQDVLTTGPWGGGGPWDLWAGRLVVTDAEGEVRTVAELARVAGIEPPSLDGPFQPRVLAAGPMVDVCPSGEVVVHTGARGELVRIGLDGREVARSELDLPLPPNSVETMVTWLTNISETLDPGPMDTREALRERSRMVAEMSEPLMEERVPPTRLRCDPQGRAWIQLFNLDDDPRGYARDWIVVDREGLHLTRVTFPRGFSPLHVGPERITGILRDDLELEVAGWVPTPDVGGSSQR
jgi:hypothetical protein